MGEFVFWGLFMFGCMCVLLKKFCTNNPAIANAGAKAAANQVFRLFK